MVCLNFTTGNFSVANRHEGGEEGKLLWRNKLLEVGLIDSRMRLRVFRKHFLKVSECLLPQISHERL